MHFSVTTRAGKEVRAFIFPKSLVQDCGFAVVFDWLEIWCVI